MTSFQPTQPKPIEPMRVSDLKARFAGLIEKETRGVEEQKSRGRAQTAPPRAESSRLARAIDGQTVDIIGHENEPVKRFPESKKNLDASKIVPINKAPPKVRESADLAQQGAGPILPPHAETPPSRLRAQTAPLRPDTEGKGKEKVQQAASRQTIVGTVTRAPERFYETALERFGKIEGRINGLNVAKKQLKFEATEEQFNQKVVDCARDLYKFKQAAKELPDSKPETERINKGIEGLENHLKSEYGKIVESHLQQIEFDAIQYGINRLDGLKGRNWNKFDELVLDCARQLEELAAKEFPDSDKIAELEQQLRPYEIEQRLHEIEFRIYDLKEIMDHSREFDDEIFAHAQNLYKFKQELQNLPSSPGAENMQRKIDDLEIGLRKLGKDIPRIDKFVKAYERNPEGKQHPLDLSLQENVAQRLRQIESDINHLKAVTDEYGKEADEEKFDEEIFGYAKELYDFKQEMKKFPSEDTQRQVDRLEKQLRALGKNLPKIDKLVKAYERNPEGKQHPLDLSLQKNVEALLARHPISQEEIKRDANLFSLTERQTRIRIAGRLAALEKGVPASIVSTIEEEWNKIKNDINAPPVERKYNKEGFTVIMNPGGGLYIKTTKIIGEGSFNDILRAYSLRPIRFVVRQRRIEESEGEEKEEESVSGKGKEKVKPYEGADSFGSIVRDDKKKESSDKDDSFGSVVRHDKKKESNDEITPVKSGKIFKKKNSDENLGIFVPQFDDLGTFVPPEPEKGYEAHFVKEDMLTINPLQNKKEMDEQRMGKPLDPEEKELLILKNLRDEYEHNMEGLCLPHECSDRNGRKSMFFEEAGYKAEGEKEFARDLIAMSELADKKKVLAIDDQLMILKMIQNGAIGLMKGHNIGIIHRDFKPQNVFCYRDGTGRLGDWSEAILKEIANPDLKLTDKVGEAEHKEANPDLKLTEEVGEAEHKEAEVEPKRKSKAFIPNPELGNIAGTPDYMAPDMASLLIYKSRKYNMKVDSWSLGMTLWTVLSGKSVMEHPANKMVYESQEFIEGKKEKQEMGKRLLDEKNRLIEELNDPKNFYPPSKQKAIHEDYLENEKNILKNEEEYASLRVLCTGRLVDRSEEYKANYQTKPGTMANLVMRLTSIDDKARPDDNIAIPEIIDWCKETEAKLRSGQIKSFRENFGLFP